MSKAGDENDTDLHSCDDVLADASLFTSPERKVVRLPRVAKDVRKVQLSVSFAQLFPTGMKGKC